MAVYNSRIISILLKKGTRKIEKREEYEQENMRRIFVTLKNSEKDNKINELTKIILIDENYKTMDELKDAVTLRFKLRETINKLFLLKFKVEIEHLNEISNDDCLYCFNASDNSQNSNKLSNDDSLIDMEDWIRLNVGGKLFITTRTTLTSRDSDSFFGRMFCYESAQNWSHKRCDNNAILIDRSSRYFEVILDYMRYGKLIMDNDLSLDGLLEEARFFSIDGLIYLIDKEVSSRHLRTKEKEELLVEQIRRALNAHEQRLDSNMKLDRRHVVQSLMQTRSDVFLRYQSINLQGSDLSKLDLSWINFKFANLSNTNLSGSNLAFSCFERADLSNANLEYAKCHGVRMTCANLENANLSCADFEDPGGKVANLEGANLKNVNAKFCNMNTVNLRVAKLKNADFTSSSLKYAKLAGADLENCILNGCDLTEANLRGANFIGTLFNDVQNPLHMSQMQILR